MPASPALESSDQQEFKRVDTADGSTLSLHVDGSRLHGSLTVEDAFGRLSVRVCSEEELKIIIQLLESARARSRQSGPLDVNVRGLLTSLDAHAALGNTSTRRR